MQDSGGPIEERVAQECRREPQEDREHRHREHPSRLVSLEDDDDEQAEPDGPEGHHRPRRHDQASYEHEEAGHQVQEDGEREEGRVDERYRTLRAV
jgi:hypothetical protein